MKKLTTILICFLCSIQLFSQQKDYIKPSEEQKATFTAAIDSLLKDYFLLSNFKNKDGEFDLEKKKQFKTLFDEKAYVIDDLSLSSSNSSILLSDYADIVSLKFSKIKKQLMIHPYQRIPLLDSILYDQYENKYEIPIKLNKIIYYYLNVDNALVEDERSINLLIYISYLNKTNTAKIAGIEEYTADITWVDCKGVENGPAYIFTPCDDNDERTEDDTFQLDCSCAGKDCEGVVGGTALKGSPCNDEDENTINDVYNDNCECQGTIECQPGTPCNDGDENTYNDIYQEDCTCLGNCFIDGEQVKIGSTCNDKNNNTYNDVYQKNCECAGVDCEGEIKGLSIIGTKCDDKNSNTVNDVWIENCVCKGVPGCTINGKTIIIGMPCNDDSTITKNDTYQEDCTCQGELICEVGSACDDRNPNTINDVYLDDCTCSGTIKKWSIYTGIGGLGYIPLNKNNSTANDLSFTPDFSYGGKLSVLLNPKNSKFYLNAGLAYAPLIFKSNKTLHPETFDDLEDNFNEPVKKLYVNLKDVNETLEVNYLQISLGISYEIISTNSLKVLVDVLAKPYLQVSAPKYEREFNVEYAGEYRQFGIPIILKNKNFHLPDNNEEVYTNVAATVILENGYRQPFEFPREKVELANLNSLFSIAGGLSFLFDVGNSGAVGLYAHYNYFVNNLDWADSSVENSLEELLKTGNRKLLGDDTFDIEKNITNYNLTLSKLPTKNTLNGLEAGLSYYIKIK